MQWVLYTKKIIDTLNILWASVKAMHIAINKLKKAKPQLLLIDGNRFKKYKRIPHECIIKGDGLYASIAAASILAKTYRDDHMVKLHNSFPHYGWDSNKGYGTPVPSKSDRTTRRLHPSPAKASIFFPGEA